MNESAFINELKEGSEFVGYFVLKRCELKETDSNFRLTIEISDKTGSVPGVIWDNAQEMKASLNKGDIVKVKGVMGSYLDKPQVRIDKIRIATGDEADPESFLPSTPKDIEVLKKTLEEFIAGITDPHLHKLANLIFGNTQFMKEYVKCPAGMRWHHPYLGGLLEHALGVAEICVFVSGQHSELNRDLLIVAALLHDVGKIKEYSTTTVIDYTDEGRLEGHIIIGERFVRNMCDRIDEFPEKLRMLLSHLMLSHQGHKAFSTPVEPMIPEGFVLYYADEIDSKLNALSRISLKTAGKGGRWSDYVNLLGRYIFVDKDYES